MYLFEFLRFPKIQAAKWMYPGYSCLQADEDTVTVRIDLSGQIERTNGQQISGT